MCFKSRMSRSRNGACMHVWGEWNYSALCLFLFGACRYQSAEGSAAHSTTMWSSAQPNIDPICSLSLCLWANVAIHFTHRCLNLYCFHALNTRTFKGLCRQAMGAPITNELVQSCVWKKQKRYWGRENKHCAVLFLQRSGVYQWRKTLKRLK